MAKAETLTKGSPQVAEKSAPKDLRSAAEQAMTAHLETFDPPEAGDDGPAAESPEMEDLKLPKDLKKSLALLAENQNSRYEPNPKFDDAENQAAQKRFEQVRALKDEKIRAHVHQISQGTPAPVLTTAAHQSLAASSSKQAVDFKLADLARSHPEVKALLLERDGLLEKIKELTKK